MANLTSLPLDVKSLIIRLIKRRADLTALYKTHSELYEAVIPLIYRSFNVRESLPISELSAALSPENRGLQHVRHVHVVSDPCERNSSARESVICMLVNLLPRDILLTFA